MSSFTESFSAKFDNDLKPGTARLYPAWVYYLDWDDETEYVNMGEGQTSDGLSGPWFMRWLFQKWDQRTLKAARAHDELYDNPLLFSTVTAACRLITRKEADELFYDMIMLGGAQWIKASRWSSYRYWNWKTRCLIAYYGLRIGGWWAWYKHRKKDAGGIRV